MRSLALNEFTTAQWSAPYEFEPAITIGDASLAAFGVQTGYWWVWLGVGVLAGYAIVFNIVTTLAFTFLSCEPLLPMLLQVTGHVCCLCTVLSDTVFMHDMTPTPTLIKCLAQIINRFMLLGDMCSQGTGSFHPYMHTLDLGFVFLVQTRSSGLP